MRATVLRIERKSAAVRAVTVMLVALMLVIASVMVASVPADRAEAASISKTTVKVGAKSYTMKLASNDAADEFRLFLSKTREFKMKELNGNERYRYLSKSFSANPQRYKKVHAGDVMLYGDNCLVVFYKTHKTSYSYTKIGWLTSTKGLAKAVGKKSVNVRFAKMKQVKGPADGASHQTGEESSDPDLPEESDARMDSGSDTESGSSTNPDEGTSTPGDDNSSSTDTASPDTPSDTSDAQNRSLVLSINGEPIEVEWANNESVAALAKMAETAPIEIRMSGYGGFEQVGGIGSSLPSDDERITTMPGDIVLYSGNQMVLFYGSNTWAYTRLGKIMGKTEAELKSMLGEQGVVVTVVCR